MGFFVRIYMHVCKKMVIYLGIKPPQSRKEREYTWQKNARISCSGNDCKYTWEKTHVYRVIILKQMADHSDQPGNISYFGHCAHLNSLISCYLYFWHCSVRYLNKVKFQCKLYVNSAKIQNKKKIKSVMKSELSDFSFGSKNMFV